MARLAYHSTGPVMPRSPRPASRPRSAPCRRWRPAGLGQPCPASHPVPARPRMIAVVLATFAASAVGAATDTVRHTGGAGRPLRGSRMWCSCRPPRCHRRAIVVDVARPPYDSVTSADGPGGGSAGCPVTSCTRTRQPPPGGSPATAMSPPRLTSTPQPSRSASSVAARSAAHALAVAPRSSRTPGGTVSSRPSSRTSCQLTSRRTVSRVAGSVGATRSKSRL